MRKDIPDPVEAFILKNNTGSARAAVFLDRDGVLNWDRHYVGTVERFAFTPGIFEFLKALQKNNYLLVVVTNQGGVGREKFTKQQYLDLRRFMHEALRREGIEIDAEMACFAHPRATLAGYKAEDHPWRKPNAGMLRYAAEALHIDLAQSWLVGDKESDIRAGITAGTGGNIWLCAGFARKAVDDAAGYDAAVETALHMDGRVNVVQSFDEALRVISAAPVT